MLPGRYNRQNVRRVVDNPRLVVGELNRLGRELNRSYYRRVGGHSGVDVTAEAWDNLLILDGCRYDLYADATPFDGPLERRRSAGSDSREFLEANFAGRELHDTVHVTANPHAYRLEDDVFHYHQNLLDEAWDPELRTVRPADVAEAAREAHREFPRKRLLVHFMQPHFPFIGETGRTLNSAGIDLHLDDGDRSGELDVWDKLRYGYVDRNLVWEAYRENLDIVLDVVRSLSDDLQGLTVVTTDHGNLVGDRLRPIPVRGFGHPRGLYVPELVEVPWQTLPAEERREIRADPPPERDTVRPSSEVVDDRLRDLGYKT